VCGLDPEFCAISKHKEWADGEKILAFEILELALIFMFHP
jgi:hypothetical protein